jgi:asparagine synthase (glutamine-hydrolysing)
MCGIFASIGSTVLRNDVVSMRERFDNIQHRGPDYTDTNYIRSRTMSAFLGFHRLAIMGLSPAENKILTHNNVSLLCNGEIYRHREFAQKYGLTLTTDSDCEVILKLYTDHMEKRDSMDALIIWDTIEYLQEAINKLDGVFAFVIWDSKREILIAARDRIGIRPLFYNESEGSTEFCSEEKGLHLNQTTKQFPPGHMLYKQVGFSDLGRWYTPPQISHINEQISRQFINKLLTESIKKRLVSDRPVGFLLSGGLDSSLVASIAAKILKNRQITTFSIGYPDSPDLAAAKTVAASIGSHHHEVILTDKDIKNNIKNLIQCLGSYDVTTIRASMPMYILSRYISKNTDIRVLFSGEGADELFAGYLYLHKAPNHRELHKELQRLVSELYLFDVRRADRTTSRWGLELRVPFLDADFVNFVMSLDPSLKMGGNRIEKKILRDAFKGSLIDSVLYRKKEAFSDGVGNRSVELLKLMAEKALYNVPFKDFPENENVALPQTKEATFYYTIFKDIFGDFNDTSHYWMPKWSPEAGHDPSARVLKNY